MLVVIYVGMLFIIAILTFILMELKNITKLLEEKGRR